MREDDGCLWFNRGEEGFRTKVISVDGAPPVLERAEYYLNAIASIPRRVEEFTKTNRNNGLPCEP